MQRAILAIFCSCTFKLSNSFLPNCQFLFCQATNFSSAKLNIFARGGTPMGGNDSTISAYFLALSCCCYPEHLQSQLETPMRTRRKMSRAKMVPDTAQTTAEVKEMDTELRSAMATAAAGYTPLILSCEWNCPPACGVRCGSDGGCRATARPSSIPPETRHPASGHSSYSLPNRAVNEPLRRFHSAWRRPLLDTFLIRGFNMVSRHEIGTTFIKEKTLVGGLLSAL